jgi:sugar phosphate permease
MSSVSTSNTALPPVRPAHPLSFRLRRSANWVTIGLTYATYYLNRYNLSLCSKAICLHFGFDNTQYGAISSGRSWAYAIGQFINGLFADRMGGRAALAIGGYGTAGLNVLFGLAWSTAPWGLYLALWHGSSPYAPLTAICSRSAARAW